MHPPVLPDELLPLRLSPVSVETAAAGETAARVKARLKPSVGRNVPVRVIVASLLHAPDTKRALCFARSLPGLGRDCAPMVGHSQEPVGVSSVLMGPRSPARSPAQYPAGSGVGMSVLLRQAEVGERTLAVEVDDVPGHLAAADVEEARSLRLQ